MGQDKLHARSTGPRQMMTRQPVEGRSRDGGFRFGEMERDCLIAHGASANINERLMKVSDEYTIFVCDECGQMAAPEKPCHVCKKATCTYPVNVPYGFKLFMQELNCMHIRLKLNLKVPVNC